MNWELHDAKMYEGIQAYRNEIRQQVVRQIGPQLPERMKRAVERRRELKADHQYGLYCEEVRRVVHRTAAVLGWPKDRILCRSHEAHLVRAREIVCYILYPKYSLSQLGRIMGRHHTTIMYTVRQGKKKYAASLDFREAVELVRAA